MKDVFNLINTDDLPESLIGQLKCCHLTDYEMQIKDIFRIAKRPLSIDEVVVACFRLHKKIINRRKMMAKLYNLSRKKGAWIESVKGTKGLYRLKSK